MVKKLMWMFIIVIVSYILLVFNAPSVADWLERALKIEWLNEKIINFKKTFDEIVTKVPTKEELDWVYNQAKDWIDTTKEKIDIIRWKAGEYKDKYDETIEYIEETTDKISWIKEDIEWFANLINTWSTEAEVEASWSINN